MGEPRCGDCDGELARLCHGKRRIARAERPGFLERDQPLARALRSRKRFSARPRGGPADVTIASASARGVTRHPLIWVALTLSLALNLCFVAGALWIHIQGPAPPVSPAERLQRIGSELVLDPTYMFALQRYTENLRTHMQLMREKVEPMMSAAWAELAKPDADQATAARLFDEAGQARRSLQREVLTPTLTFLATLSPEQRGKFVKLFHQRPKAGGHPLQSGPH